MHLKKTADPYELFDRWFTRAKAKEKDVPDAAALATAGSDGMPSVRMVLIKAVDRDGFVFYTNLGSHKADEMADNAQAALCFHWKSLQRQVRVEGLVELVSDEQADAYFASRARTSQIGAWASKQSQTLEGRFELEAAVAKYTAKFNVSKIPRPSFWSGYRIRPTRLEFWDQGQFRLHDRLEYCATDDGWATRFLSP